MKKKCSKILSLVLAMLMVLSMLVGCGKETSNDEGANAGASTPTSTPTTSGNEAETPQPTAAVKLEDVDFSNVEFRIGWWGGDARHNKTLEMLKSFQSKYKNLTIQTQYTGFGDFFTQIETQLTGNIEPDLYQMDWAKIMNFINSDQLLDLTPYIESGALDMSNVDPSTTMIGNINGGIYAIATGVNAPIYYYNTAIAEKAGVTINKTMTWDEVIEVCKEVYDKTGAWAHFDFEGFVRARGETYYTADGSAVGFSAETLAEWLEFWFEGMEYGFLVSPDKAPDSMATGFSNNEYWLGFAFTNQLDTNEKSYGVDLDWIAYPITDENKATSFLKPNCLWVINADTAQPDLAVAFLNYWVNDVAAYEYCGIDRGFPISSKVVDALAPNFDDANNEVVKMLNYLADEKLLSTIEPPAPAGGSAAKNVWASYIEQVEYKLFDKADCLSKAEECIAKMNKELQTK